MQKKKTMTKLFIEDLPIAGKRILMRVDFNVPLDDDSNVLDATRIKASLPSIQYVLKQGGSLILMSHLGRPQGAVSKKDSLAPVAKVLSAMLEKPVQMAPDCVGPDVQNLAKGLKPGDVLLLENLRFHRAEEFPEEDPSFAKDLASLADFYVNDAFGTAHRKHSSTYTITQYFPGKAAAGYLMEKEIHFLGEVLENPKRPFLALIGGAKISTKIGVLKSLTKHVDTLLIGGGMAYTFLKAKGLSVGDSICDEECIPEAKELIDLCKRKNIHLELPTDAIIAKESSNDAETQIVSLKNGIPPGHQGLDIGPETIKSFTKALQNSNTILWNGPVGVYEFHRFAKGTEALAKVMASCIGTTIAGGGDLIAAINQAGVSDGFTHISTGGGATLEFIENGSLPGIDALSDMGASQRAHN